MQLTFYDMWKNQRKGVPAPPTADLKGKVVLVTGANTGLGYEAAKHFARMGPAKVIIACRSQSKGQEAIDREYPL